MEALRKLSRAEAVAEVVLAPSCKKIFDKPKHHLRVVLFCRFTRQITISVRKHDTSEMPTVTQGPPSPRNQRHLDSRLSPNSLNTFTNQKKKPLDFSRGFCITGGSGEIRTRDQRIKRRGIVFEQ